MTINIEQTFKICAHVHYFPGNFIIDYGPQTLSDLAQVITEAMVNHNFDQAMAFDAQGHDLMTVTLTST